MVITNNELLCKGMTINIKGALSEPNRFHTVPVAVMMKGHLSFVIFSFKDSKVLRLMQLFVAPVSYKALILRPKLLIGKTVPVAGPTAIVQISTKCLSVLCTSL